MDCSSSFIYPILRYIIRGELRLVMLWMEIDGLSIISQCVLFQQIAPSGGLLSYTRMDTSAYS